jgi:DNA-binding MarR family transcriptional regulator
VRLTRQGKKDARDLFRIGRDMLQEMTADWSPTELDQFTALMQRMNQAAADYEQRLLQSGPHDT